MQNNLLTRAKVFHKANTVTLTSKKDFYDYFKQEKSGFAYAYWKEDDAIEQQIKKDLGVTPRCIPLRKKDDVGPCIFSDGQQGNLTLFAKAY